MNRLMIVLLAIAASVAAGLATWQLAQQTIPCSGEQLSCSIQGFVFTFGVAGYAFIAALIMAVAVLWRGARALHIATSVLLAAIVGLAILADWLGAISPRHSGEAWFVIGLLYGPAAVGVLAGWLTLWKFTPPST